MKQNRVLFILGDSPTKETGFARVVRSLLEHWMAAGVFDEIWIWGIGYWGAPHDYPKSVKIFPAAGPTDGRWESIENLQKFVALMQTVRPTHLWMLQDLWGVNPLAKAIAQLREQTGMEATLYFPVDAALEPEWTHIIEAVDHAVAYTNYGAAEARRALLRPLGNRHLDKARSARAREIQVIPHGVDVGIFHPLGPAERAELRRKFFKGTVPESDVVLINVNSNQRRKGLAQSLQILAELKRLRASSPDLPRFRLYLHMENENKLEGVSLPLIARQLDLVENADVFWGDGNFIHGRPKLTDAGLNEVYNVADIYLTTTLGEGWGFGITEAMAAGLLVAAPDHTACTDLLNGGRGLALPLGQSDVLPGDNSRLRARVSVTDSAALIAAVVRAGHLREEMIASALEWVRQPEMQWEAIARRWLDLMGVGEVSSVERGAWSVEREDDQSNQG